MNYDRTSAPGHYYAQQQMEQIHSILDFDNIDFPPAVFERIKEIIINAWWDGNAKGYREGKQDITNTINVILAKNHDDLIKLLNEKKE